MRYAIGGENGTNGTDETVPRSLSPDVWESTVPETVIGFPQADVQDAKVVTKILEKYIGTPVVIKSDGRIARFSRENNKASLKRHNDSRIASESLDKVIEASYPVGWNVGDASPKHAKILGQYIYAAAFNVKNDAGIKTAYIARIVLDGMGNENEGVFKEIAVKKNRGRHVYGF